MTALHAVAGPVLLSALLALAVVAGACAIAGRLPRGVDLARRILLAVVVSQAAIGLALAVRGAAPREAIHWLYGGMIVAALLVPGALRPDLPEGRRSMALAGGAALAAVMAWRLGASG